MLLFEDMPVALEEESGDDGDVEHTEAGGEEVCCAVDVVIGDGTDGGKADDVEAEFASFEQDEYAKQGGDFGGKYSLEVARPWQGAVYDEVDACGEE